MTRLAITDWVRTRGSIASDIEHERRVRFLQEPYAATRAVLEDAVRNALHMGGIAPNPGVPSAQRTQVIGVTGPRGKEGKTTLATAISGTLARHEERGVVLVDTDPHSNTVAREYGLTEHFGLADYFAGDATLVNATWTSRARHLSVIPAGTRPMPPVSSAQLSALLEQLRASHDYVVFDLPAALRSTTASPFARLCDGVMVVVRAGSTTTQDLDRSLQRLGDARVLGVIVNRWQTRIPRFVERTLGLGM